MKKLLILCLLFSCESPRKLELTENKNVVINIEGDTIPGRYGDFYYYRIKLFNGQETEWFDVNKSDFDKIKLGDTLTKFYIKEK